MQQCTKESVNGEIMERYRGHESFWLHQKLRKEKLIKKKTSQRPTFVSHLDLDTSCVHELL